MRSDSQRLEHARHFKYRAAVDGLRGVAVLAVLAFHAFPRTVSGGYIGVDVFFVISGFLITSIIARQLSHEDFSFGDFYWRRVRRLFPALVLVLASSLTLGWFLLLPDEFEQLGKHVTAASMFAANFVFWRESGYFDVAAEFKPLLHLWSLGIEEQFYLLWPALLVTLWRRRTLLIVVVSVLLIVSFTLSAALSTRAPLVNFYSPFTRFWELGAGCLLALMKEYPSRFELSMGLQGRSATALLHAILPITGLAFIVTSVFLFDGRTPFPGWAALLPVTGTLVVLATPEHARFQRYVIGSRPLVWTGLISYALYLWHWPLLSFANILEAGAPPVAIRWAALALSFLLAWLTYRFIELPVRKRRVPKVNLGLAVAAGIAGIAGVSVYAAEGFAHRFDVNVRALDHQHERDPLCTSRLNDERINYCRASSARAPAILFVGDSRAQALYEAAAPLLSNEHSVMLLARGGCPPVLNIRMRGHDPNEEDCGDVWRRFVDYAREVKPEVIVIMGGGSELVSNPNVQIARGANTFVEPKDAVFEYGLRSLLQELTAFSRVVYVREIPAFATAPSCFLRPLRLPTTQCAPERERGQVEQAMAVYNRILNRVDNEIEGVQFVDALDVLCAGNVCSQWPDGKPILYSDAVHLSPAGARILVRETELVPLILGGTASSG